MTDNDRARQRIIASVFDKRNAGADVQESYVAHIKIWEDSDGQGKKPRYILISRPYSLLCLLPHLTSFQARPIILASSTSQSSTPTAPSPWARHGSSQNSEASRSSTYVAPLLSPSTHLPHPSSPSRSTSPSQGRTSGRQRTPSTRLRSSGQSSTSSVLSSVLPSISLAWMTHPVSCTTLTPTAHRNRPLQT